MMQLGARGLALIKSFEKLVLVGYADEGGVPTAGWGHTGPDVAIGGVYTADQAEAWIVADTASAVAAVNHSLTAPVTQNQFDAMVVFAYNVGDNAEAHSTLVKLINAGHVQAAADEFPKWDHVRGQVSPGLLRRDLAERDLFLAA